MVLRLQLDETDAEFLRQAADVSRMSPEHFAFIALQNAIAESQRAAHKDGKDRLARVAVAVKELDQLGRHLPVLSNDSLRRETFYEE